MLNGFLLKLNTFLDAAFFSRQEIADELNSAFNRINRTCNMKYYSRSRVSKELSGSKRIVKNDLQYWYAILEIDEAAQQEFDSLFQFYDFNNSLPQEQLQKMEKIQKLFSVFQELSLPRARYDYEHFEPYADGLICDTNSIQIAIQQELIREFHNPQPRIDVFLPQKSAYYYSQIKQLLSGSYSDKKIDIRQIITFSASRKDTQESEFDLLDFLPDILYLYYINPNSYHLYCSYSDSQISKIDGLVLPYYICTSDCLIRISQHQRTAWISHSPSDVSVYHEMFNSRLSLPTVKPFSQQFDSFESFFECFCGPDSAIFLAGLSCQPCFAYYLYSIENILDVCNYTWGLPFGIAEDTLKQYIQQYIDRFERLRSDISQEMLLIDYCTYEGIRHFAETGNMLEFPPGLLKPLSIQDRIRILTLYKNMLNNSNRTGISNYILKREVISPMCSYKLTVSDKNVVTYPLGFKNLEIMLIKEPKLVADVQFFFYHYLPNSEFVYPKPYASKLVQGLIDELEQAEQKL